GRGPRALDEHAAIVAAIRDRDEHAAYEALKSHISIADRCNDSGVFVQGAGAPTGGGQRRCRHQRHGPID
ncbi:MAG: FCD domain-containing protein, partial [Pseudomonadota bacterium]